MPKDRQWIDKMSKDILNWADEMEYGKKIKDIKDDGLEEIALSLAKNNENPELNSIPFVIAATQSVGGSDLAGAIVLPKGRSYLIFNKATAIEIIGNLYDFIESCEKNKSHTGKQIVN